MTKAQIPPMEEAISTVDRLLDVATTAFARKGYYGTSIRDLARDVHLSVATLYYYAKNKDDLYLMVFERQYKEEAKLVIDILATADESTTRNPVALRKLLYQLMDALIDRSTANPDIVRLWTQRWLERPKQTEGIETQFFIPLYQMVEDLLNRAQTLGVIDPGLPNLDFVTHSFTWLHYGYFGMGKLTFRTEAEFLNPDQIEEFRTFIHIFVDRMLRFSDQYQD
ncbi:MAG TPA: TetR/AcrR family transcriptional regulator [Anaerolineales bacterium]|nr:TetR/AcrR family transcriptional regulator [Anaerolineales bacterium]